MTTSTYGVRDLINALIDARQWANASPELRDHAWKKYAALAAAFGISEDERPGVKRAHGNDQRGLQSLFEEATDRVLALVSPFAIFYEGSPEIARIYRHHGPAINDRLGAARHAVVDLLIDLVTVRWAVPPATTVTGDDLRACGFDPDAPEPDEADFL
jgi:hypothetical protein